MNDENILKFAELCQKHRASSMEMSLAIADMEASLLEISAQLARLNDGMRFVQDDNTKIKMIGIMVNSVNESARRVRSFAASMRAHADQLKAEIC